MTTLQGYLYTVCMGCEKATAEMLEGIDALIFDIQDIGVRFYSYITTMTLAMEACAEHGKEVIVLDRPNPIGGTVVSGNIIEEEFTSFLGGFQGFPYGMGLQ